MKQIQRILFPIDLASSYETLIPWVQRFAEQFNATVYLLFVLLEVPPFITFYARSIDIKSCRERVQEAANQKMADVVKDLFKDFPKLKTSVEFGSPAERILEFASREKVDLIVRAAAAARGSNWRCLAAWPLL